MSLQTLDTGQYNYEEVSLGIAKIKGLNFPLPDVPNRYCEELSEFMSKHSYDYFLGMMNIFIYPDISTDSATAECLLATEESSSVVEDGFNLNILDCCHWHAVVDICTRVASIHGQQASSPCISSCAKTELIKSDLSLLSSSTFATILCSDVSQLNNS